MRWCRHLHLVQALARLNLHVGQQPVWRPPCILLKYLWETERCAVKIVHRRWGGARRESAHYGDRSHVAVAVRAYRLPALSNKWARQAQADMHTQHKRTGKRNENPTFSTRSPASAIPL
jgi:hypothetical protein